MGNSPPKLMCLYTMSFGPVSLIGANSNGSKTRVWIRLYISDHSEGCQMLLELHLLGF